jgi:uncharacterized damage-inducible protein DinB
MQLKTEALQTLDATRRFFDRTTRCLTEADSLFRATPGTWTIATHVAHVAQTLDWFREGCFENRWRMDFEAMIAETATASSLAAERARLAEAWERLRDRVAAATEAELAAPLADNPILPGRPLVHIVEAVVDHTGHHRGALAVCARLAGRVPEMPYAD